MAVRSINSFVQQHFAVLMTAVAVWLLLAATASIVYRRRKGKHILASRPADAIFFERWTSGRSNRNLFTKLGAANNCLLVALTPASVIIRVHFPFSLLFLPEIYDLEQTIPRSNIASAQRISSKIIELTFQTPTGIKRSFNLRLKNPDSFLAALNST
jgi:hypothetical protein